MATVRMILLTAVLSCLIWVVADQLDTGKITVEAVIKPAVPSGSDLAVTIVEPSNAGVRLDIRGPNAALATLRADAPGARLTIRWDVDETMGVGEHTLSVASIAADDPVLRSLSVDSSKPAEIKANVDRYVTHVIRLGVNSGLYKLAGEAQIEPATVAVRMLESDWLAVGASSLSLNIEPQLKDLPEGTLETLEIPLPTELGGRPAAYTPRSATVALTLVQRDMRKSLSPVVVKFAVSPDVANRYRIELRDDAEGTTDVEVIGPAERVGPLRPQDIFGVIEVTREDAAAGQFVRHRPEIYQLPAGVRIAGEPPFIEFRLVPFPEP